MSAATPRPEPTGPPRPRPAPGRSLTRPTLLPGLRRLWRGRRSIQLGVDPARAVVLELPDTGTARLLDLLDGTRSAQAVVADAGRARIPAADARAVLAALHRAGMVVAAPALLPRLPDPVRRRLAPEAAALALRDRARPPGQRGPGTPAQILRRRAAARVVVSGGGPLAAPVALTLAQAGVGHVVPAFRPAPARATDPPGQPDPGQVATAMARLAPGTRTGPVPPGEISFVVRIGAPVPANLAAAGHARRRQPHLLAEVRDGVVVVGPLVPPRGRPCLHCLDLHRQDRDPAWPLLAAQLADPDPGPCAAATTLSVAGFIVAEVLRWLDGETPLTLGASVEIASPGQLRRRSWSPHPRCPCLRRRPARRDRRGILVG